MSKPVNIFATALVVACFGLMGTGCSPPGKTISAEAVEPLILIVSARHDSYVENDATLSVDDQATYLRSTRLLRDMLEAASGRVITAPVEPNQP